MSNLQRSTLVGPASRLFNDITCLHPLACRPRREDGVDFAAVHEYDVLLMRWTHVGRDVKPAICVQRSHKPGPEASHVGHCDLKLLNDLAEPGILLRVVD
jgi:hypothetical protein